MIRAYLLVMILSQVVYVQSCDPADDPGSFTEPSGSNSGTVAGQVFTTSDGVRFQVETVASNLEIPWSLNFAPDGRLFVTERPGRVRIFSSLAGSPSTALTLDDVSAEGEGGLLGLALDPDFAQTRLVYLYYTAQTRGGSVNRVVRFREVGGQLTERVLLLDNIPAASNHNGGRLRFGPDGLLYITTGDAAVAELSQDFASLAGKILRLNRDGTTPRGNPFGSPIYSAGHRNPQGFDWHPATGDFWSDEHGSIGNDEVNTIDPGDNYGWPVIEGSETMPGMRTPVTFYSPAVAPSGSSFYRSQRIPGFTNNLFVATLRGTALLRLRISGTQIAAQERLLDGDFGRLRDVITGPDGAIYICTNNRDGRGSPIVTDDRILRIVPAS